MVVWSVLPVVLSSPLLTTIGSLMDGVEGIPDDENTPLLNAQLESTKQERTPLPWLQITIILLLHTCEPISSQSIYPYINEVFTFCFCPGQSY